MATRELLPTTFSHVDDESLALIIQIQQSDGEEIAGSAKGKQKEGEICDAEIAIQLYLDELARMAMFTADLRMSKSLQMAVIEDANALGEAANEETAAQNDRNLSIALSRGCDNAAETSAEVNSENSDDAELLDKMACVYVTGIDDVQSEDDLEVELGTVYGSWTQGESSSSAASRPQPRKDRRTCIACEDVRHFSDVARAPCRHEYCRGCLQRLFQDAIVDESLFPPRCCKQPIPLDKNIFFLSQTLVDRFRKKSLEYSTPNRTYCHRTSCSTFIPPSRYLDGVATCPECQSQTCTSCKRESHGGDCPEDEQLQQVIQLARAEGWQRCQNCWQGVELLHGCNHMKCRCGFEFCYNCGAKWHECNCAEWDEHRLLERAEEIDARDHAPEEGVHDIDAAGGPEILPLPPAVEHPVFQPPVFQPPVVRPPVVEPPVVQPPIFRPPVFQPPVVESRRERLDRIVQNLRANHECDHDRWRGRGGPRMCEECNDVMPLFIYECRQCHIMACRRCRYNRL